MNQTQLNGVALQYGIDLGHRDYFRETLAKKQPAPAQKTGLQ